LRPGFSPGALVDSECPDPQGPFTVDGTRFLPMSDLAQRIRSGDIRHLVLASFRNPRAIAGLALAAQEQIATFFESDGAVIIDPQACKGSHNCVEACPYGGVIFFNEDLRIAQKCTFCAHLLDKGWTDTRCSEVCPTGAFTFGEESDLADLIAKAEVLHPEFSTKPRVYYIGLPRMFIAGTVYDPKADEIVEGAKVTLRRESASGVTELGSTEVIVITDEFGDFWADGLDKGTYLIFIEKDGYAGKKLGPTEVTKDLNVGDIPMESTGGARS